MQDSELKPPYAELLGIEIWLDSQDRLMLSIPSNHKVNEFAFPIRNEQGELITTLLFKKRLDVKTQSLFSVEKVVEGNVQNSNQLLSLLSALGFLSLMPSSQKE